MHISRRQLLQNTSFGFGYLAFSGLSTAAIAGQQFRGPLAVKPPHFAPKAKRVIFLCMRGGPSHVDTFDFKPLLSKHAGQSPPTAGGRKKNQKRTLMPSPWKFSPRGNSGIPISNLYPHLSKHADDLCLLNGVHTDIPNHPQALVQLHTGNFQFVRPSVGAWTLYGLGTENESLPGFITIKPPARLGGAQNYGSAFLPAVYQGTRIGRRGQSLKSANLNNISNPDLNDQAQRKQLAVLQDLNRKLADTHPSNRQIEGVIESYELAFRMQSSVPRLLDITQESAQTLSAYGIDEQATDDFGRQCLMARRCAEAGVRYIELCHEGWDQHRSLKAKLDSNCKATDQPIAALIADLKQRDMLKDTLLVWGGEFGRTPAVKQQDGRDHNSTGFSMWMAGGGVRGGMRYGATDDFGISAVTDKLHTHDLHATMLHLLGLDHTKLTYRYAGRDFRLTDVHGTVAKDIIL